jgi:hypothetical protein
MNKVAAFFFCCLLCLSFGVGVTAFQKEDGAAQSVEKTYPRHMNLQAVTFKELKDGDVKQEQFNVEGYVESVYECPPCPKGAMCKPCMGDHVVVTAKKGDGRNPAAADDLLRILARSPKQFEVGKQYLFSVKLVGEKKAGEKIEQVELIGYDIVEEVDKH